MAERPMTRAEAMALLDEKRLVEQGYEFLDEKRVILAGEIMSRLTSWRDLEKRRDAAFARAREALGEGIRRFGFEALALREVSAEAHAPEIRPVRFLGAELIDAEAAAGGSKGGPEPSARGVAGRAGDAFADLADVLGEMAVLSANLYRLAEEYRRTEQRAKALENVLIPEIVADLGRIEAQLEANDMEDAIRVRIAAR